MTGRRDDVLCHITIIVMQQDLLYSGMLLRYNVRDEPNVELEELRMALRP